MPQLGISSIFLQSISSPVKAIVLSLIRDVIVFVPLTILLPIGLGIEGVLWAAPISDAIALVFTCVLVFLKLRKLEKNNSFANKYSYNVAK